MTGEFDMTATGGRCASRRAGISFPTAASGWERWPCPRSWAAIARRWRGSDREPSPSRLRGAGGPSGRRGESDGGAAGAFPGAGAERHLPVHGRRAQPARAVRLQAASSRNTAASRSPTRSSRDAGSRSWTSSPRSTPSCWGRSASSPGTASRAHGSRQLLPHLAEVVDDLTFVKSVATDVFNHAPAKLFANTGPSQFGRPSMGSWVTYGIGSESHDLPGFVVLQSGPRGPRGGAVNWGSGFLPVGLPGRAVPRRRRADPEPRDARGHLAAAASAGPSRRSPRLNRAQLAATADPEIATRIAAYEMAYRMQTSAPELIDLVRRRPRR